MIPVLAQDRSWVARKVGDLLRRLPWPRRRALVDAIEAKTTHDWTYPERREGLVISTGGKPTGLSTWTPPAPYHLTGDDPDARQGTGGQLDDDNGESGSS